MSTAIRESDVVDYSDAAIIKGKKIYNYNSVVEHFVPHWHRRLEILYLREGTFYYTLGSKKGVLRAEQALIVPSGVVHQGTSKCAGVYNILMFDIRYFYNESKVCKQLFPKIFNGEVTFDAVTDDKEVLAVLNKICDEVDVDSIEAVAEIYRLIHVMIKKGVLKPNGNKSSLQLKEVTDYIEENCEKELSTADLCKRFGYTSAHFCRKFKNAIGVTPVTFINLCRLEKAKKMIMNNEGQIWEIAFSCGFSDANYFTRCFKAHFKHPPTYYKNAENILSYDS